MKSPLIQNNREGNVLIITISMVAVIAGMIGVGTMLNTTMLRNADRSQHYLEAHALASGALEALYAQWRQVAVNSPTNTGTNPPKLDSITAPAITGVTDGLVQLVKPTLGIDAATNNLVRLPMDAGVSSDNIALSGQSTSPTYKATASVQIDSFAGTVDMTVSQIFRYSGAAPTDWAIIEFVPQRIENDIPVAGALEVHPGPKMVVEKVHTNGTLYTAHNSLYFEDAVTFGDNWYSNYHPENNRGSTPSGPNYDNTLPPVKGDRYTFFDIDPDELELGVRAGVDTVDSNPNNDGYRELLDPPVSGHGDPLNPNNVQVESQRPYDQAAVKIEVSSDVLTVRTRNGTAVATNDPLYKAVVKSINPAYDISTLEPTVTLAPDGVTEIRTPAPAVNLSNSSSYQTIRDNRTGGDIQLTTLDVSVLTQAFEGGLTSSGVTVAADDGTGTEIIPSLANYDFGFASGDASEDETRAIIDTGSSALPNGWNGAIHFEDKSADYDTSAHRGLRLRRAAKLPQVKRTGTGGDNTLVGMSFITPNPAYIEGDFNTGSVYSTTLADLASGTATFDGNMLDDTVATGPASNRSDNNDFSLFDGDNHVVSGYQDAGSPTDSPIIPPASVMADAVNILSNAWDDSNSFSGVGSRVADHTTVNTAIISGVVPTGAYDDEGQRINYSGGAENYPRFLEKWSNKTFVYHGSMIMAFESEQAYVRWGKGNVYNPPKRKWFHEDSFKTISVNGIPVNNPPPLLPQRVYSYPRSPVLVENFTVN